MFELVLIFSFLTNLQCISAIDTVTVHEDETLSHTWTKRAQQALSDHVMHAMAPVPDQAKSAILAVGAGMSIDTLTAARFLQGKDVEQETPLYFESFPVLGMAKTYCVDSQVGEAACTATAYLSGMKSKADIVGAAPTGSSLRCGIPDEIDKLRLGSITEWALAAGKSVGIITTSSVTHPGVAGSYGQSTRSSWQNDNDVVNDGFDPSECPDLAVQLLQSDPGNKFKVILGGGRQNFLPNTTLGGKRLDNNNLITDWMNERINMRHQHKYVGTKEELMDVEESVDYLLGLFTLDDFQYHTLAGSDQPSLEEMTEAAIKVLSKNENGFFLYIFGGKIGDGHNENKAILALHETIELSTAIKKASTMTTNDETLIVVSANHAHTMKLAGYGSRWTSFFETITNTSAEQDDFEYLSINYANGPGYRAFTDGHRPVLQNEEKFINGDPSFQFLAHVPLDFGTGGGDDVVIFARGPSQRLFHGFMDQHILPHLMAYSLCVGQGITACDNTSEPVIEENVSQSVSSSSKLSTSILMMGILSFTVARL